MLFSWKQDDKMLQSLLKLWCCSGEMIAWTQILVAQNLIKPWRLLYIHAGRKWWWLWRNGSQQCAGHAWYVHAAVSQHGILSTLYSYALSGKRQTLWLVGGFLISSCIEASMCPWSHYLLQGRATQNVRQLQCCHLPTQYLHVLSPVFFWHATVHWLEASAYHFF